MPQKLVLEVKIHDATSQLPVENPTVVATFQPAATGGGSVWSTPVGKPSGPQKWAFDDARNDFGWDESGGLLLQLVSGSEELG